MGQAHGATIQTRIAAIVTVCAVATALLRPRPVTSASAVIQAAAASGAQQKPKDMVKNPRTGKPMKARDPHENERFQQMKAGIDVPDDDSLYA